MKLFRWPHDADKVNQRKENAEDDNQSMNDAIKLYLMAKQVRPAPLDSGNDTGDTKRR